MARVFISYKRVDKERVFKIKDLIESAIGEKCWIDISGIESDAQFANVIIEAIDECDIFLFMFSKAHSIIDDFETDWTIRELTYATSEHKRVIFINIDNTELKGWFKFMYGTKQQVDWSSEDQKAKLLIDLCKWLKNKESKKEDVFILGFFVWLCENQKVQDPDVQLFYGVAKNDPSIIKQAIDKGANLNITDKDLFVRYKDKYKEYKIISNNIN